MDKPLALVLDVGTTALKASLVNPEGGFAASRVCPWGYASVPGVPGGLSFRPEALLDHFQALTKELFAADGTYSKRTAAVIVSAQRLGFVLLDRAEKPLCGIPNIDRRAVREASAFQDSRWEAYYPVTGRWPGPQHLISRLRWWRENAPEALQNTGHILSVSDWLAYALCGILASDPTTACESCLLDIRSLSWSTELLSQESLPKSLFCQLLPPGTRMGAAHGPAARALGLAPGTPVMLGAGDTQLGVLGAGCLLPGDCAVVAGSSAPVNTVMDAPKVDPRFRTVTNPFLMPGAYVMEANAMLTGVSFTFVKELLFGDAPDGYTALEEIARDYLAHAESLGGFVTIAGASTADTRRGNLYRNGVIAFPVDELNAGVLTRGAFAFSAFEAAAYAILRNMEIIGEAGGGAPERLALGGGETRMSLWMELMRVMSQVPMFRIGAPDMTSLGAAALAFAAVSVHPSPKEAARAMVHGREVNDPAWLRARPFAGALLARKEAWAAAFSRYHIR